MKVRSMLVRAAFTVILVGACNKPAGTNSPALRTAAKSQDLFAVHLELENMVDAERAAERDREYAYEHSQRVSDDGSAKWAFARAAITGRLAEAKGLKALWLIKEIETYARMSIERDPAFEGAAARRMLGTLYVLAGDHVEHGDSEQGLEMLEELLDADDQNVHNQLRVAEGYISLGDPDPALEVLCLADSQREKLRPDEQRLLDRLFDDVGGRELVPCG